MARILCADDEPNNVALLEAVLKVGGHEILTAADGVEALALAQRETPDLIITDILMPRMDGYRFCMEAKKDPRLRTIPFIFYTASYTEKADEELASQLGASRYLRKPVEPRELLATVEEVLAEGGVPTVSDPAAIREIESLERYSKRLVEKLEQKVAELEETTSTLEPLVSSSPLAIVAVDPNGLVRLWNPAAEQLFGWSEDEALGSPLPFANSEGEAVSAILEPSSAGLDVHSHTRDGQDVILRIAASKISDAHGAHRGTMAVIENVTAYRRAQGDLKLSLERLQRTLDSTIAAMVRVVEIRDPYTAGHQERVAQLAVAMGERLAMTDDQLTAMRIAGMLHDIGKLYVPAEILSKPGRLTSAEFEIIKSHPAVSMEILSTIEFVLPVATIAGQHHERLDGSGYPDGITAELILPEARVLAVADVVEAMSTHRPYRPAHGIESSLDFVRQEAGGTLDADAVAACCAVFEEDGFVLD